MSMFAHLHLHTQYSFLSSTIHISRLFAKVKELGMDSVAITDHGNMFGSMHFYNEAKKWNIKPIIGCEVYITAGESLEKKEDKKNHFLVLLAENQEGYKNLSYLVSIGFTKGFYYRPRIDKKVLHNHSKGLIALSAGVWGEIGQNIINNQTEQAKNTITKFQEIFGKNNFFLEISETGFSDQNIVNEQLKQFSRELDVPLVATNDCHYVERNEAHAHEILVCIQQNKSFNDPSRKRHESDSLYIRSHDEMKELFRDVPSAFENAIEIAKRCHVNLDSVNPDIPSYRVPEGYTIESWIEQEAKKGLEERIKNLPYQIDTKQYHDRLDFELRVINQMKFPGYFLVVADFIQWAKQNHIPVGPGRGSGAGSLVAFSLKITNLDPIPYHLLFERFLNPDRVSMPDFDIDFCQNRRGEVIQYVKQKYGSDNVGQIATFSALNAKSVIKDVARVLDVPFSEINKPTKLIPNLINGKKVSLQQALELVPELKQIHPEIINNSMILEGLYRQQGVHAAGVVIGNKPLYEYVPISIDKNGEPCTQFSMEYVENAGLIKFDFLGLKTLTVIDYALNIINAKKENDLVNLDLIPLDDHKVYETISSGNTLGIFQVESSGFQDLMKKLKPDCFEDIVASVALYRPGPLETGMVGDFVDCKHGRKKVTYPHQMLETILKPTYGVIVYQEQVMQIAQVMAGFSLGRADILRRAMGKKKKDVMAEQEKMFVDGAVQNGVNERKAKEIFELIEKFAGYGFNKSHSAAYALITYQTAYLKTYYPVQFLAALLSTEMDSTDDIVKYVGEARLQKIEVLSPCINRSEKIFVAEGDKIRFGLGAIKGLGSAAIDTIIDARKKHGKYISLFDFCEKVDLRKVNKKVLESCVKSGAFDVFGMDRAKMYASIEMVMDISQKRAKEKQDGQGSLFDIIIKKGDTKDSSDERYAQTFEEWDNLISLNYEKEVLGCYISDHPLHGFSQILKSITQTTIRDLPNISSNTAITLGGLVAHFRIFNAKDGSGRFARFTFEDLFGQCECMIFKQGYALYGSLLSSDQPLLIHGSVMASFNNNSDSDDDSDNEKENEKKQIRVEKIELLSQARPELSQVTIRMNKEKITNDIITQIKSVFKKFQGKSKIHIEMIINQEGKVRLEISDAFKVSANENFIYSIEKILGRDSVILR